MSTPTTGTRPSTALHERYLIERLRERGSYRPEEGLRADLDFLWREGLLLPDEEFQARRERGEPVDIENLV